MNARYYLPAIGRFLTADTLVPDPANPQSFNRYAYVLNNPLRFTDPSGHCGADTVTQTMAIAMPTPPDTSQLYTIVTYATMDQDKYNQCIAIRSQLYDLYGWTVEGTWFLDDVQTLLEAGAALVAWFANGGAHNPEFVTKAVLGGTTFRYASDTSVFRSGSGGYHHVMGTEVIMLEHFTLFSVIHELGHVLDNKLSNKTWLGGSAVWGGGVSDIFADQVGMTGHGGCILRFKCKGTYTGTDWDDGSPEENRYWSNGAPEDFAQAFKFSVLQDLETRSLERDRFFNMLRVNLITQYDSNR